MTIEEDALALTRYPAYHTVGLRQLMAETGAANGQSSPVSPATIARIHQIHRAIRAEGFLRPACTPEESSFRPVDRFAGDDRYIFLSVGKRDWRLTEEASFGFIFDAPSLLDRGAMIRPADLYDPYRFALNELIARSVAGNDWRQVISTGEQPGRADYLALWDAVQAYDLSVPGVREILAAFREKARTIQKENQLRGNAAKAFLPRIDYITPELLVYKKLPLAWAIAAFEYGKITPLA